MTASQWEFFTVEELSCHGTDCCGGKADMDDDFMRKIVILRRELGFPFPISSAFRCGKHNSAVSSTGETGPHTTKKAIDIAVSHNQAVQLLKTAIMSDLFTGIGINQKGSGRFIHLDTLDREAIWTY